MLLDNVIPSNSHFKIQWIHIYHVTTLENHLVLETWNKMVCVLKKLSYCSNIGARVALNGACSVMPSVYYINIPLTKPFI